MSISALNSHFPKLHAPPRVTTTTKSFAARPPTLAFLSDPHVQSIDLTATNSNKNKQRDHKMEERGKEESRIISFQEFAYNFDDNLDEFLDLIREDKAADDPILNFTSEAYDFDDLNDDVFDLPVINSVAEFNSTTSVGDELQNDDVEEKRRDDEGESSTSDKRKESDRSTTLMSERRRRSRVKEKLFALRSMVPNITKMDKASIVGDAVLYVQELQKQANKFKSEIATLDSSYRDRCRTTFQEHPLVRGASFLSSGHLARL